MDRKSRPGSGHSSQPARHTTFSFLPQLSVMDAKSHRRKGRDSILSSLNAAIDVVNVAKDVMGMTPAKAALGAVSVLLTLIRVGHPRPALADFKLMCAGHHDQRRGPCRPRFSLR